MNGRKIQQSSLKLLSHSWIADEGSCPLSLPVLKYPPTYATVQVTDQMLANARHVYPHNTPGTKEAYYYRMLFERCFPQVSPLFLSPLSHTLNGFLIYEFIGLVVSKFPSDPFSPLWYEGQTIDRLEVK